jgi:hypothetical protein
VFAIGSENFLAFNFRLTRTFDNDTTVISTCTGLYSDGFVAPKAWLPCDNSNLMFRLAVANAVSDLHLELLSTSVDP